LSGRPATAPHWVAIFFAEPERICRQFAARVLEYCDAVEEVRAMLSAVIGGNANVTNFDMRKYYAVARLLLDG
jgi:hypothetical protein